MKCVNKIKRLMICTVFAAFFAFPTTLHVSANEIGTDTVSDSTEIIGDYAEDTGFINSDIPDGCPITIKAYVMDECKNSRYSAYATFLSENGTEYSFQLMRENDYAKYVKLPDGEYTVFGGICSDNRRIYRLFSYQEKLTIISGCPVYFDCLVGTPEWIEENKDKLNGYIPEIKESDDTELEEAVTVIFSESENKPDDHSKFSFIDITKPICLCIVLAVILLVLHRRKQK